MQFSPDRPAPEVDTALRKSLEEVRRAEGHAVLWFTEVNRRRLYRELGFGSIYQYAEESLGFSRSRTAQFLRLATAMETLPRLRESVIRGRTTWTKARAVIRVATAKTDAAWVGRAETLGRRELEQRVARVLAAARHRRDRGRPTLSLSQPTPAQPAATAPVTPSRSVASTNGTPAKAAHGAAPDPSPPIAPLFADQDAEREAAEVPVTVTLRMSPVQAARYEALLEAARKRGMREDVVDLVLAGLDEAVAASGGSPRHRVESQSTPEEATPQAVPPSLRQCTRVHTSPYEIHLAVCPSCARGRVETNRGVRILGLPELRAAACDARVRGQEGVNRSTIPPRVRRAVLDRDGHRCRAAGCGATRFLEVHHRVPRSRGGSNRPTNLITLCSGCHRATHIHEPGDEPLRN